MNLFSYNNNNIYIIIAVIDKSILPIHEINPRCRVNRLIIIKSGRSHHNNHMRLVSLCLRNGQMPTMSQIKLAPPYPPLAEAAQMTAPVDTPRLPRGSLQGEYYKIMTSI